MRWTRGTESSHVEDRRGQRIGMTGRIGLGTLLLLFLGFVAQRYLGVDLGIGTGGDDDSSQSSTAPIDKAHDPDAETVDFVKFVIEDCEGTWKQIFAARGQSYRYANLVLYNGGTRTACGFGSAAVGPFYCPGDQKVYIDLSFYRLLRDRFKAPGEFAEAYVLAHEIGHHVQTLLGLEDRMRRAQRGDRSRENDLSVRYELQADCLAGVWGHSTRERHLLDPSDVEDGLRAAAAIGDDTLQRQAGRSVQPETFTHGTSEQRARWLRRGLEAGTIEACDTGGAL